jgi:hypothetical protein
MIRGLKIEIPTQELREHIEARAQYHRDKAEWYAGQVRNLRAGGEGLGEYHASNDPVASLQRSEHSHQERCAFFSFLAEHLIADETYRLTEEDLSRLEFISRYL